MTRTHDEIEACRTAEAAIKDSARQNRIVHLEWSRELEIELLAACDDSAENGDVQEYWGHSRTANDWRVHLDR